VQINYPTYSRKLYYDQLQRIIRTKDILDANTTPTRSHAFDAVGNMLTRTDEEGMTTLFEYDGLNRLINISDPLNGVVQRTYDDRDNLIAIKDPNNGFTRYEYDRNKRLVKVIRPLGDETTFEYDAGGNRTAIWDAKGQKIEYEYDASNWLSRVRYYTTGDHSTPVKTVDFTYDKLGNLKTYDDGITSAVYTYDEPWGQTLICAFSVRYFFSSPLSLSNLRLVSLIRLLTFE